jgi:hypothetical protein
MLKTGAATTALVWLAAPAVVQAVQIDVPATEPTIQDAIDVAVAGDEIVVAPGTYPENLTLNKAVTLRSTAGAAMTVIDGSNVGSVLSISADATVEGFTFTNGLANSGGGLHASGAVNVVVRDCTFADNMGNLDGGGMTWNSSGSLLVDRCVFSCNDGQLSGGAMEIKTLNSSVVITNCEFELNVAVNGGAINGLAGTMTVASSLFARNSTLLTGQGGAIVTKQGSPLMVNCTFYANAALPGNGGGVRVTATGSPVISNSVFWENADGGGNDESAQIDVEVGSSVTVEFSFVQNLSTFDIVGSGNIGVSPLLPGFVDEPGLDMMVGTGDEDLRLAPGSPAIDAGSNAAVPLDVDTDLDGVARIQGVPPIVDMGAYESGDCPNDCNGNGIGDACEIDQGLAPDCNANGVPDECDIAEMQSDDCNDNGIPDECEPDCNMNGIADECDIADGTSMDANGNGIPDECESTSDDDDDDSDDDDDDDDDDGGGLGYG